jgi:hypothetical protein
MKLKDFDRAIVFLFFLFIGVFAMKNIVKWGATELNIPGLAVVFN